MYLSPYFSIFNLSLQTNVIHDVCKATFVLPLLKGGDPGVLNNYHPISKLHILANVFEKVNIQLKECLGAANILSCLHSG